MSMLVSWIVRRLGPAGILVAVVVLLMLTLVAVNASGQSFAPSNVFMIYSHSPSGGKAFHYTTVVNKQNGIEQSTLYGGLTVNKRLVRVHTVKDETIVSTFKTYVVHQDGLKTTYSLHRNLKLDAPRSFRLKIQPALRKMMIHGRWAYLQFYEVNAFIPSLPVMG
jgi:hypothetical protein